MKEIIDKINIDLKKCNDVQSTDNLLEIAITIEEMIDSYKSDIKEITKLEKSNVWSYKKDDLMKVQDILLHNKEKLTKQYNQEIIINAFESTIADLENNNKILENKKAEVIEIIGEIKKIIYEDKSIENKWDEIRKYLEYISKEDFIVGYELLNLINKVIIIKI